MVSEVGRIISSSSSLASGSTITPLPSGAFFQTMVCYYCTLLCKTFHMFRFTAEERLRNQQRKIGIHVSRFLKHIVQLTLHFLPDSVSVRFDHHTATHSRLFCQIGLHHQLIIPLRIILAAFGQVFLILLPFYFVF